MTTVFQFGGGKDSLACLYLLKPRWDDIIVMWVNTGTAFPEVIELMDQVRQEVPHFVEIHSDAAGYIHRHGFPVDVLPVRNTEFELMLNDNGAMMQAWIPCCRDNRWLPLHKACIEMKATTIIRGQKDTDTYKSPIRHGDVADGVRYEFPIQEWTDRDVLSYLRELGKLPAYYEHVATSLDCWNCTAWIYSRKDQMQYMSEHHPAKYRQVRNNLEVIREAIRRESSHIEEVLA